MISFVLGGVAGIVLAVLNLYASAFYTSKTLTTFKPASIALTLLGFFVRLLLIAIIFYGLSTVKEIHFRTALISFIIAFTVCLIWKAARIYQKSRPMVTRQTEL